MSVLIGCGETAPPTPPTPEVAVTAARLATLGTVGALPSKHRRLVVAVDARGTVVSRDGIVDLAGVRSLLIAEAEKATRFVGYQSRLYVVLRLDASLPWRVAEMLLKACRDPAVGVYRTLFAARAEADGNEGAMGLFQPLPRGLGGSVLVPDLPIFSVHLAPGKAAFPSDALFARASDALRWEDPAVGALVSPDPSVSVGTVLRTVDALYRAGIAQVDLRRSRTLYATWDSLAVPRPVGKPSALADHLAAHPSTGDRCLVTVGEVTLVEHGSSARMPPTARVTGRLAGVPQDEEDEDRASASPTAPGSADMWREEHLQFLEIEDEKATPPPK
jgi:hypothetical protein